MKVTLIRYTPRPDEACAIAARTCTSFEIPEEADLDTLAKALESGHESLAEHASFTFAVDGISRACSHQLVRHRMASYSQQSQRYVNMDGFGYVTPPSIKNHEKTWDEDGKTDVEKWYTTVMEALSEFYASLIAAGIPEEDARYILPNACKTNIVVTMNGRELRHFCSLRCCNRAQWEIRKLAEEMRILAQNVAPVIMKGAGPRCEQLGYCPEARGCGKYPKKVERA